MKLLPLWPGVSLRRAEAPTEFSASTSSSRYWSIQSDELGGLFGVYIGPRLHRGSPRLKGAGCTTRILAHLTVRLPWATATVPMRTPTHDHRAGARVHDDARSGVGCRESTSIRDMKVAGDDSYPDGRFTATLPASTGRPPRERC